MQLIITLITLISVLLGSIPWGGGDNKKEDDALSAPAVSAFGEVHHALEEAMQAAQEPAEAEAEAPAETASETEAEASASPAHADIRFEDIRYEHYDPTWFYEDADNLCALADEGRAEEVVDLYDDLYDRMAYVDMLSCYAMVRHDQDMRDDEWQEEYLYMDSLWMEMSDALSTAAAHVLESSVSDIFAEHIGEVAAEDYSDYTPLTDEQVEANDRENELLEEYHALYDEMGEISCTYRGETWTLEEFSGLRGDALSRRDYDAYVDIYYGLQKALVDAFCPLFIELTQLYARDARSEGYDSFEDYAYESYYARDYTPADAQVFCDAIKPLAREYYANLYYSDEYYKAQEIGAMTTEELLATAAEYLPLVDESLTEPFAYMTEHGMYDVQPGGGGRYDGSYTTVLSYYGAPFMFITAEDSCFDLITLTHEFGHFSDFYMNPVPSVLLGGGSLDLQEIHSNGLEALFTSFYGDIFGGGADTAAFANLEFLLDNVVSGCMYDEFQRRVFAEADDLTAEKVNRIYLDICIDYGIYDSDDVPEYDASWVYISHLFESPLYYISYAASGIAALQLWDMAQADFGAAADAYMTVLRADAYEEEYLAVLRRAGLRGFAEDGAVGEILRPVLDELAVLERSSRRHN